MDDELRLDGRTALVTGAGRNIGRAVVLEFASRGANVVINARSNAAEAESVADEARRLGAKALVVLGDVGEPDTIDRLAQQALDTFGAVDISVSNAARRLYKDFFETTHEDWHRHLNMQLSASWYLAKALAPSMRDNGWGRLVHINGPDGWYGGQRRIPHSVAKGGLRTLTKVLARELGPFGITVNDVVPGFTDTIRDPTTHPQLTSDFTDAAIQEISIRRPVTVEEIAWACAWLAAPRSAAISGAAIHVDGGWHMLG